MGAELNFGEAAGRVLFVSSDEAAGAIQRSADGSAFSVMFEPAIQVPRGSNPRIGLTSASVWNSFENIRAALNNVRLYYTNDGGNLTKYHVDLQDGVYEPGDVEGELNRLIAANGHNLVLRVQGVDATSKIKLTKEAGSSWLVNLAAGTVGSILGFTAGTTLPTNGSPSTGTATIISQNQATLNVVTSLMLNTSIAAGRSNLNGGEASALCAMSPDVAPGRLFTFQPHTVLWIDLGGMDGSSISQARFWLSDESGGAVNTHGEIWAATIWLRWD